MEGQRHQAAAVALVRLGLEERSSLRKLALKTKIPFANSKFQSETETPQIDHRFHFFVVDIPPVVKWP